MKKKWQFYQLITITVVPRLSPLWWGLWARINLVCIPWNIVNVWDNWVETFCGSFIHLKWTHASQVGERHMAKQYMTLTLLIMQLSLTYSKCLVKIWFNAIKYAEENKKTWTFVMKRDHPMTEYDIAKIETLHGTDQTEILILIFIQILFGEGREPLSESGNNMKDVDHLTARQLSKLPQCNLNKKLPCASPFYNNSPYFFVFLLHI